MIYTAKQFHSQIQKYSSLWEYSLNTKQLCEVVKDVKNFQHVDDSEFKDISQDPTAEFSKTSHYLQKERKKRRNLKNRQRSLSMEEGTERKSKLSAKKSTERKTSMRQFKSAEGQKSRAKVVDVFCDVCLPSRSVWLLKIYHLNRNY